MRSSKSYLQFLIVLAFSVLLTSSAYAGCTGSGTSWSCTAGSTISDVQSAVNNASDGATITFASGSYNWSSGQISLNNAKGVTLACSSVGACTVTVGSNTAVALDSLYGTNTHLYRITGFNFQNSNGAITLWFYGMRGGTMNNCRIDHNKFQNGTNSPIWILFGEQSSHDKIFCLVDHNTVTGSSSAMLLKVLGPTAVTDWPSSLRGTANNVFVEDNVINISNADNLGQGCIDSWAAAGVVFRFNTVTNCLTTAHGVTHGTTVNWEIYGNSFNRTAGSGGTWENGTRLVHHQGSGEMVVFGNRWTASGTLSGSALALTHYRSATPSQSGASTQCDGTQSIDGNFSSSSTYHGYPCWMQPGRAPGGTSYGVKSPIYTWQNVNTATGGKVPLAIEDPWGGSLINYHIVANRDYYDAVSNQAQSSSSSPFNGTTGMGFGSLSNRPGSCTTDPLEAGKGGVGYWATDQGSWNKSGNSFGQGQLYKCTATNTWTLAYTPYTYPHPLQSGSTAGSGTTTPPPPSGLQVIVK